MTKIQEDGRETQEEYHWEERLTIWDGRRIHSWEDSQKGRGGNSWASKGAWKEQFKALKAFPEDRRTFGKRPGVFFAIGQSLIICRIEQVCFDATNLIVSGSPESKRVTRLTESDMLGMPRNSQ